MKKWLLGFVFVLTVISTLNAQNIVKAEYFWDTDPGPGNGTNISIAVPSPNISTVVTVSAAGLTPGIHSLYFRSRDSNGKWGLFEGTIVLATAQSATNNIVQLEYFWDTDPGAGNASAIPVGSPNSNLTVTGVIQASSSLSPGIHNLYIRAKDSNNEWSLFGGTIVLVTPVVISNITELEYFWDSDPGPGNGTALTPTSAGLTVNESFSITAPNSLSQGNHLLIVRSRNAEGTWSLFAFDTVAISGVLPLQLLSFTGQKQNTGVYLKWTTTNEVNTSQFEIERSVNGVSFLPIGRVEAVNATGTNEYHFIDQLPLQQVNFYRLRQIDKDGKFTYSNVIRILNVSENGLSLHISPNPASTQITIDYTTNEKKILINIYDREGRLVEQSTQQNHTPFLLPVGNLPNGLYFIHLSDGVQSAIGKFIKE